MAEYWSNDDGLVVSFGTKDRVKKGRIASMGGDIQTLTLDIVGTELGDTASTAHLEGAASIPAGAHLFAATLHVTTVFTSGGAATLDLGVYNSSTQAIIDEDGIDVDIALTAIDAVGDTITCDGALVDTILANDSTFAASYETAAFTDGIGKLIVEYYMP